MPADPTPLRALVRHPVPVLWRMARSGRRMLSDDVARTPVTLRGVAPGRFEIRDFGLATLGSQESLRSSPFRVFEGRVWHHATSMDAQMRALSTRIAKGRDPTARFERGLWEWGPPYRMELATHLFQNEGFHGRPLPGPARRAPILRLDDAAAARVRDHAALDLVHDGTRILVAGPPPGLFGFAKPATNLPRAVYGIATGAVRPANADYLQPYGRIADAEAYVALMRRHGHAGGRRADDMLRAAAHSAPALAGLAEDDGDLDLFLNAAPSELLDILRQRPRMPDAEEVADPLWPLAALGSIGAIGRDARDDAFLAVRAAAAAIRDGHPLARHRNRCALLVDYVDAIARPRLGEALADADVLSLAGLAP